MTSVDLAPMKTVLSSRPWVKLAILFGSEARGEGTPRSDFDIAFLPDNSDLSLTDELLLQSDLERALGRTVDLVRIDRASTLLAFRVARDGVLILERIPGDFSGFVARAASEYIDFAPSFEAASERFRRALLR